MPEYDVATKAELVVDVLEVMCTPERLTRLAESAGHISTVFEANGLNRDQATELTAAVIGGVVRSMLDQ